MTPPRPVPKPRTSIQNTQRRRSNYERSKSVDMEYSDNLPAKFSVYSSMDQTQPQQQFSGPPQPTPRKSVQKQRTISNNELFNTPKMQVYSSDLLFRRNSNDFIMGNMHRKYKSIVTEPVTLSPPMMEGHLDETNSSKISRQSSYAKMSNSASGSRYGF